MNITKKHLEYVKGLGYKITTVKESSARGFVRTYLVGECLVGHEIKSEIRKSMQTPTCKQCYYDSMSNTIENLKILEDLGYRVDSYVKKIPSGRNKTFIKGVCLNNHEISVGLLRFMLNPHCKKCPNYNKATLVDHLDLLQKMGYDVAIIKNINTGGWSISSISGFCPNRHEIKKITRPVPNPRCNECYNNSIRESNLKIALDEGYRVEIVLKEQLNGSPRTYFIGKCPNGHSFEMKVIDFITSQQRCSPCKKDLIVKRIKEVIASTEYNLEVERVPVKGRDRDSRLFVVGTCPNGHKVSMNALSFESGSRCKGCTKYGFSTGRSAIFYIISGSNINMREKVNPNIGEISLKSKVIKYGIFHPSSGRLQIHASRGFSPEPNLALYHEDSKIVAELERRAKNLLIKNSIQSCKDIGLSFDGATESFIEEDLALSTFRRKITSLIKEVELEYATSFIKLTIREAVTLRDRSNSVLTKDSQTKTLEKIAARLSSKNSSVHRIKGLK